MRSLELIDYFGKTTKDRGLPQGIYRHNDKFRVMDYDPKNGRTLRSRVVDTEAEALKLLKLWRDAHHWFGVQHDPMGNFGFIYRITHKPSGREYIGSKQYWRWVGPQGGYKCTDVTDAEWFNPNLWAPMSWEYYASSCDEIVKMHRASPDDFHFEVLSLHTDKLSLHLEEIRLQMQEDVLNAEMPDGSYKYFNGNIASRIFRAPISKTHMRKLKEASIKRASDLIDYYITKPQVCSCGRILLYGETLCH